MGDMEKGNGEEDDEDYEPEIIGISPARDAQRMNCKVTCDPFNVTRIFREHRVFNE